MEGTQSTEPPRRLDACDKAQLAAYAVVALLGTWQWCLLVDDGAISLAAAWLGDAWKLYYGHVPGRAVSAMTQFGLAWALRPLFGGSSDAFLYAAHALYFAAPLVFWLILRRVEPQPIYSRLYLAVAPMIVFFPSEMVAGLGLWLIWFAWLAGPARSATSLTLATLLLAPAIAFTHPGIALLSLLVAMVGGLLMLLGRPLPRRQIVGAAAMAVLLIAAFAVTVTSFKSSNPTVVLNMDRNRFDYINPVWLLATMAIFPMLPAVWLLLLAPGTESAGVRWKLPPIAVLAIGTIGLWFAAANTGLLTWLYARHSAAQVTAVALALALVAPAVWLAHARRPLMFCAAIVSVAALSYSVDLLLFGRFVDRHVRAGIIDVEAPGVGWPTQAASAFGLRDYAKWFSAPDYVRDVVVPTYDWYEVTLAVYSYFRSDRRGILFHPLQRGDAWIPFECEAIDEARRRPHDARDEMFLGFLSEKYCVR
jgi:hypothetical protein